MTGAAKHPLIPIAIIGRYHDTEVELRGSQAGLQALSTALRDFVPAHFAMRAAASAAPYAGVLRTLTVEPDDGPVILSHSGDGLTIRGDARRRAILAENIEATWELHGSASRDHLHIEYFESHVCLGAGSVATVLVLEPAA